LVIGWFGWFIIFFFNFNYKVRLVIGWFGWFIIFFFLIVGLMKWSFIRYLFVHFFRVY